MAEQPLMKDYQTAESKIERQISLPFREALKISTRNITIRFGRALITVAGTFLGIAFLMSVFTGSLILDAVHRAEGTQADAGMAARQIWLVVMSLLVCGVGITNSMLMSVTERFREIGTMKCLGALDGFIVRLYLIESALMGVIGSFAGALAGMLAMVLVYALKGGTAVLAGVRWLALDTAKPDSVFEYFVVSLVIGTVISIVAAVPAASHAAKMPAAAALRTEI
jgi:predicted lysophospholipase L1 biosynthesis ABC-type transport system permease subunit